MNKVTSNLFFERVTEFSQSIDTIGSELTGTAIHITGLNSFTRDGDDEPTILGVNTQNGYNISFGAIARLEVDGSPLFKNILTKLGMTLEQAKESDLDMTGLLTSMSFKVVKATHRSFNGEKSYTVKSYANYPSFEDQIKGQSMETEDWAELRKGGLVESPVPVYKYAVTNVAYDVPKATPKRRARK